MNGHDATEFAALLEADELAELWVPGENHETTRVKHRRRRYLGVHRQQVRALLLKHGKIQARSGARHL